MEVDEDHLRREFLQDLVHQAEGVVVTGHKHAPLHINDGVLHALARLTFIPAMPGGTGREVRGTNQPASLAAGGIIHVLHDVALVPNVIARGNDADAMLEKFLGDLWRNAKTSSGVFTVSNDEVDSVLGNYLRQAMLDDGASGASENVSDE